MKFPLLFSLIVLSFDLLAAPVSPARAEDSASFRIEFDDGKVAPLRLEVPANKTIEIELVNKGQGPAEFESKQLRKEKVLAPGATTTLVIRGLDPGEYDFFDDFHPDAPPAVLVAK
jgi:hypothetical protein